MENFSEPTINYIKMAPRGMEVRKKGLVNVHMVFEQGKKNMTYYTTPFGTIQMGIAATNLALDESEDSLNMKVDYALDMNEEHIADCYLNDSGTAERLRKFYIIKKAARSQMKGSLEFYFSFFSPLSFLKRAKKPFFSSFQV